MKHEVEVSKTHICTGNPNDPVLCALAIAVAEHFGMPVNVSGVGITVKDDQEEWEWYGTDFAVESWIDCFDTDKTKVLPCTVVLDDEIMMAYLKSVGNPVL